LFELSKLPPPLPDPPRAEPAPPLSTSSLSEEGTTPPNRDERVNLRLVNSTGDE
jgi:hypothetical protein